MSSSGVQGGPAVVPIRSASQAQRIVRLDAIVELALGTVLVVSALSPLHADLAWPDSITRPMIAVAGLLLLPVALTLGLAARTHTSARGILPALASGNAVTAVAVLVWVAVARSHFGVLSGGLVLLVAAVLVQLALVQARLVITSQRSGG